MGSLSVARLREANGYVRLISKKALANPTITIAGDRRLAAVIVRMICQFAAVIAGGFQVPSPAGRIEGASVFGQ